MALLNGVFGGSSDNMLTSIRTTIQKEAKDPAFPIDAVNTEISRAGRTAYFDSDSIARFFSNTYGNKLTFLALSILYPDYNWGSVTFHQDHIFPKDIISQKNMKNVGFNIDRITNCLEIRDRLGNLELLSPSENTEKSNQPFLGGGQFYDISKRLNKTTQGVKVEEEKIPGNKFRQYRQTYVKRENPSITTVRG